MKDNEEREQNSEFVLSGEVFFVKSLSRFVDLEFFLEEFDIVGVDLGFLDEKDSLGVEVVFGVLGQVKVKVEVCKDESVGKFSQ